MTPLQLISHLHDVFADVNNDLYSEDQITYRYTGNMLYVVSGLGQVEKFRFTDKEYSLEADPSLPGETASIPVIQHLEKYGTHEIELSDTEGITEYILNLFNI